MLYMGLRPKVSKTGWSLGVAAKVSGMNTAYFLPVWRNDVNVF